jgi:hypothetical protein
MEGTTLSEIVMGSKWGLQMLRDMTLMQQRRVTGRVCPGLMALFEAGEKLTMGGITPL